MEKQLKEIKIFLYILVVMAGMQMGFTFNKLNMMKIKMMWFIQYVRIIL